MGEGRSGNAGDRVRVDSSAIRDANAAAVALLLREDGPLARAEVGRRTGLTRTTVSAIVRSLLDADVLREVGTGTVARQGGRPEALLAFHPGQASVAVGIMSPGGVRATLADAYGRPVAAAERPLDGTDAPEAVVRHLADQVRAVAAGPDGPDEIHGAEGHEGDDVGPLRAAAVLLPGRVDRRTGVCVSFPPYGWNDLAVRDPLEQALQVPVTVMNPAAASVLGEVSRGRADDQDAVLVFLDVGIGVGIVSAGSLVDGSAGGAGDLGHLRVPGTDRVCRCGRTGCLETLAAGWAIREAAAAVVGADVAATATLRDLEQLADPAVDAVLARAATDLGLAVSWVVDLLDPRTVLLGGTAFAHGAPAFLDAFERSVRANGSALARRVEIGPAGLQADLDGATQAALALLPETIRPRRLLGG